MIDGWRDRWLLEFFESDVFSKRIPSDLRPRLFRKLQLLDDASCDADLRIPANTHFEKLSGGLDGYHSIRVNDKWRLIFVWVDGKARDIYLDDHSYR